MTAKKRPTPNGKRVSKGAKRRTSARKTLRKAVNVSKDGPYQAVCDSGDFDGPERSRRAEATKDALRHQDATGHAVTVIQID